MQTDEHRVHRGIAAAMTMVILSIGTAAWAHDRSDATRSGSQEVTFSGNVISVDAKAQTITVKTITDGKAVEMAFHVNPETRLVIGADEPALLRELRPGDSVTVTYESAEAAAHNVKQHGKKSA